ncbi:hypothetical protein [Chondrinema litorale]|uniref:hypothetical protein n=1 Tax=Chondrinema litorale TaxID=2994555 RepID=UPI002542DABB|nr:hypothetical protein [Chondrinema litorale]UZR95444.1 hypothetical protein OQ292_06405 [Chondrinema litorale]
MATEKNETATSANDAKIDAIKQLIFGENIKEYDGEFKKIRETINHVKQEMNEKLENTASELRRLIDTVNAEQNSKLDKLRSDMDAEVAQLKQQKLDRQLLGDLLQEIGNKIKE